MLLIIMKSTRIYSSIRKFEGTFLASSLFVSFIRLSINKILLIYLLLFLGLFEVLNKTSR